MRPKSIIQFEILFFVMLIGGFLMLALGWNETMAQMRSTPNIDQLGESFPLMLVIWTLVAGTVINLLLWFFIARKGSQVAKWIYVVLFGLGVFGLVMGLAGGTMPAGWRGFVTVAMTVIHAVAVWLLFRPDTVDWFASGGKRVDLEDTFR